MFGRTKANGKDVFEIEEQLGHELQGAREQLAEVAGQIAAADTEYRRAAADALTSGSDDAAIKLKRTLEKLAVRKDGLGVRIADLEPKYQEAGRLAQAERLKLAEAARRARLAAAVAEGRVAVEEIQKLFEPLMRAVSRLDDARAALFGTLEFNPVGGHPEGAAEAGRLADMLAQVGPQSLRGQLVAAGWRERTTMRPTTITIVGLIAPPGA